MESITEQVYSGGAWTGDRVSYYRYHLGGSGGGEHQVKYILGPEEYERLAADPEVSDPFTTSDEKVAEYAATYLEYDADGEVSLRKEAGSLTTTLQTTESDYDGTDRNQWKYKRVETRGDGGVRTRYENYLGQPILEEFQESASASESILEYREYDSSGNPTLHARSSALESYSVGSYAITPTYKSESGQFTVGLVHLYDYYSTTTTSTGGVAAAGLKQHDKIRQGRDGTPIKLRTYEYTEHSAVIVPPDTGLSSSNSSSSSSGLSSEFAATIYPIAKVVEYRNEDGTGQIETSFAYQWHLGTLEMQQRITTLPAVPVTQNGSGVAATRTERFDQFGNLIWLKDERGYITYHEYDVALGKVIQTIQDVDDGVLTLPSGWSTPADGGKHIISDYEYDDLGRQTQMLGPEHTVDISGTAKNIRRASWTVYDDVNRETRSAQGYYDVDAETYTLVNPVSIQIRNAAGTRSESIQATRASTSGKLLASDTFAQSSYVRWSVALSNNVGQKTASRVYHTIPTSGDGGSGTHYSETKFDYDSLGRQNVVETPGGTIAWTVFDKRDRGVCTYVGTNDTGAAEDDPSAGREPCSLLTCSSSSSSASGAAGNNMVLVSQQQYDDSGCTSCGSGGGQLTLDIQYTNAATTRITDFQYDWRGRQEFVIPPADDEGRAVANNRADGKLWRLPRTMLLLVLLDRCIPLVEFHVGKKVLVLFRDKLPCLFSGVDDRWIDSNFLHQLDHLMFHVLKVRHVWKHRIIGARFPPVLRDERFHLIGDRHGLENIAVVVFEQFKVLADATLLVFLSAAARAWGIAGDFSVSHLKGPVESGPHIQFIIIFRSTITDATRRSPKYTVSLHGRWT